MKCHTTIYCNVHLVSSGGTGGQVGKFQLHKIATPLPFCFSDCATYDNTNVKMVWVRGGASSLEKRQCTIQVTLFAEGQPQVKPLLIFSGKGKRIPNDEKVNTFVGCMYVYLSPLSLAYSLTHTFLPPSSSTMMTELWLHFSPMHGAIMREWIIQLRKPACDKNMLLTLDEHKAQQKTQAIKIA